MGLLYIAVVVQLKGPHIQKIQISYRKIFIFGIVLNSVARLESFIKNYIEYKFLVTGNYKDNYLKQATDDNLKSLFDDRSNYVYKSPGRFNIRDGKKYGHIIYALNADFVAKFKKYYSHQYQKNIPKDKGR